MAILALLFLWWELRLCVKSVDGFSFCEWWAGSSPRKSIGVVKIVVNLECSIRSDGSQRKGFPFERGSRNYVCLFSAHSAHENMARTIWLRCTASHISYEFTLWNLYECLEFVWTSTERFLIGVEWVNFNRVSESIISSIFQENSGSCGFAEKVARSALV